MCVSRQDAHDDKDWQELVTTLASLYDSNAMKITYKKKHTVYFLKKHACMYVAAYAVLLNNTVNNNSGTYTKRPTATYIK